MDLSHRYDRNKRSISAEQQEQLKDASVLIIGCGGLGGYIAEALARIGVGHLTVLDGDVFDVSNLNRQLVSNEANIGKSKASETAARLALVNSEVQVEALHVLATEENIDDLVRGKDVVVDALDNSKTKLLAARACAKAGIPFIHGAIAGWYVRVHTVLPGDDILETLCSADHGAEKIYGNLSFTAAACGNLEAAEAVKVLLGLGTDTSKRLIEFDLLRMTMDEVELG